MPEIKHRALKRDSSALIIVDIQEKLFHVMSERENLLAESVKLISGIRTLKVPIVITEQYPKGLGPTVTPVIEALGDDYRPISKVEFSCFGNDGFMQGLEQLNGIKDLIVMGIESHVCVYQTVLDALNACYSVHVVTDAVSSRTIKNRTLGIKKCESMGASLTSVETVLFELLKSAKADAFKEISKIVK